MLSKLQFLRRKKKTILISLETSTLTNGDIIKITSRSSWLEKGGGLVQTFKRESDRGGVSKWCQSCERQSLVTVNFIGAAEPPLIYIDISFWNEYRR